MGDDDDMEKKAVYQGTTLEWSADGLGVRPYRRHVRSLLRELGMETRRSVSTSLSLTVEKEGDRSDRPGGECGTSHETSSSQLHGLCTWHRIDWIWEWRQLSSPKPWQFQEKVTMNVSNALRDNLHGNPDYVQRYHFRKKQTQSFCPRMLIGPPVAKHVVQIQESTVQLGEPSHRGMEPGSTAHCSELGRSGIVCGPARDL